MAESSNIDVRTLESQPLLIPPWANAGLVVGFTVLIEVWATDVFPGVPSPSLEFSISLATFPS